MPRTYKCVKKPYNEETVQIALDDVANGASIRKTARRYHMTFGMLRNRVDMRRKNIEHTDNRVSSYM